MCGFHSVTILMSNDKINFPPIHFCFPQNGFSNPLSGASNGWLRTAFH